RERSFIFGTVMRIAAKLRRAQKRRREVPSEDDVERSDSAPNAEAALDDKEARELLDQVLSELPDELRTVFVLFELEEVTLSEIGDLLGLPQGTVASRLRRAREFFEASAKRLRARRGLT